MQVQPRVDMRRFGRAAEKLVARHDSLRIRFKKVKGQFRAIVGPVARDVVREVDIGDQDDATFKARITEIAHAPMPLMDNQLAELVVVHCGRRGDVIVWRVHHAITDGYGLVLLAEDLMKFLVGLPISSKALCYAEYVSRYLEVSPERAAEISAFWRKMHQDLPKAPNIGRKAKGLEPLWYNLGDVEGRRKSVNVTYQSMAALEKTASKSGLRSTSVLFAGFLESLCQLYDTDRLAYTTLLSRSDPGLASYAGAHYFDPILPYNAVGSDRLQPAAERLFENMMQANFHLPSDAASQSTRYEDDLVEAGIYPRQFSVHQPRPTGRIKRSIFGSFSKLVSGEAQRIGRYLFRPIDVSIYLRSRTDLRFALREAGATVGFDLEYDGISYSDEEIQALSAKVCDLVGLDSV